MLLLTVVKGAPCLSHVATSPLGPYGPGQIRPDVSHFRAINLLSCYQLQAHEISCFDAYITYGAMA